MRAEDVPVEEMGLDEAWALLQRCAAVCREDSGAAVMGVAKTPDDPDRGRGFVCVKLGGTWAEAEKMAFGLFATLRLSLVDVIAEQARILGVDAAELATLIDSMAADMHKAQDTNISRSVRPDEGE